MRKLSIAVLITNMLIIVGFGHGIAPIALFEFFMIYNLDNDTFAFSSMQGAYERSIYVSAVIFIVGQTLLLIASLNCKRYLILGAVFILLSGFIYLSFDIVNRNPGSSIALITGSPFLVLSILLIKKVRHPYVREAS